jgi:kumamolisin
MPKLNLGGLRAPVGLTALSLAAVLALGAAEPAQAAPTAVKTFLQPAVKDLGVASPTDMKTLTIGLAVRNAAALETLIESLTNPASPSFRQFLTPASFAAQFGQTPGSVAQVVAFLQAQGFTITNVHANNLMITVRGSNAQIAATFGTTIHSYSQGGIQYQAPSTAAVVPTQFAGIVAAVSGLSNKPAVQSRRTALPNAGALSCDVSAAVVLPTPAAFATNIPGSYTVGDLAAKYNINPLYAKGYTGAGKTIGIATLAGYDQSDAYAYWSAVGLTVDPARITDVPVDGGALAADGPGSDGAGETTLDVEQSGGVAPGAKIRVYVAPNTDSGFVDVFAQAVEEDLVDVLSVSWGSPEIEYDNAGLSLYHTVFLQAAAQGIPVIAAAGDAGAYDINRGYPYPDCSALLTVDFPAADPYVLAAGGTTLPNTVVHKHGPVTVTQERPWGWDYLKDYIVTYYGQSLYYASYFAVGGGGGVSVDFAVPSYQTGLAGMAKSAAAQSFLCDANVTGAGYQDLVDLPPGIAGRNLPDVALNADPYSGYLLYFGGAFGGNEGGTSFVAPQLNGILTLISQGIPVTAQNPKGRVGRPAPQFYAAFKAQGYSAASPFKSITTGDNEYYKAAATFNPASGLGSLNVDALATALGAVAP